MEEIRREKRMFNTQISEKIPLISFRYSKDVTENKVSVRFMHPTRAEIYVHLQGDCTFFVGDRVHRLSYGDILIYNKDEVHFNTIEKNTVWERFVIFFLPEHFNFINNIQENLFNFFYERNNYHSNCIQLPQDKREQLIDILFEIDRFDGGNQFQQDLHLYRNLIDILQIINDGYLHPYKLQKSDKTPQIVQDTINYINSNFSTGITLDTIASHMNISKSYLSSLFKKHLGVSPYEYLLNIRLERAKRLLSYGENISDACYASGFSDYSHFIQFFKKRTGVTPFQYKKQHHNKP